jgi:hypothetical protein
MELSDDNALVENSRTPRYFLQRVIYIILGRSGPDRSKIFHLYLHAVRIALDFRYNKMTTPVANRSSMATYHVANFSRTDRS